MKQHMRELEARHPIVGAARSLGLFGIVELVKDRKTMEPLAPFNGTSEPMLKLGRFFREEGLYTFVRWNTFITNPPLIDHRGGARARVRHHRPGARGDSVTVGIGDQGSGLGLGIGGNRGVCSKSPAAAS